MKINLFQLKNNHVQNNNQYPNNEECLNPSIEHESHQIYVQCKQAKHQQCEMLTPAMIRNKTVKKPLVNIFNSFTTTPSTSSIGRSGSQDDFSCPQKQFEYSKIQIDKSDDLEQRIHDWLDQQDVKIADPYDKVYDFYHRARLNAFNHIFDSQQDSELNTLESLPTTSSLKKATSMLVMGTSPIIQRRNKIQSSENRSEFGNRHFHLQDHEQSEVNEFQHA